MTCGLFGKIENHLGRCVWESSNEQISVFPWHVRFRLDVGLESEFVARKNGGKVRFGKTKKKWQELNALAGDEHYTTNALDFSALDCSCLLGV